MLTTIPPSLFCQRNTPEILLSLGGKTDERKKREERCISERCDHLMIYVYMIETFTMILIRDIYKEWSRPVFTGG